MLNIFTIFIVTPLFLLVLVGVFLAAYEIKKDTSAKLWIAGCMSLAASYVFAAFRTAAQGDQSFALSNVLMLLGVILTFMAFEKLFNGRNRSVPLAVLGSVVFGEGLAYMVGTPMEANIGIAVGVVFGLTHVYFAYQFSTLPKHSSIYTRALIGISSLHGLLWLARGISGLLLGFHLISSQMMTNVAYVVVFVMLSTARQLIYLILRVSATSIERKQLVEFDAQKNKLITSLLKLNKTVATNALSLTVAHEVSQPLTAIKHVLANMRNQLDVAPFNRTEFMRDIDWIETDLDRATDTVNALRAISQGKPTLSERCSLKDLVDSVLNISSYDLKKRGISVVQDVPHDCAVNGSSSELRQVLLNIFLNATDALESVNGRPRQIHFSAQRIDHEVQLHIEDNGPGIPSGQESEIFELMQTYKPNGSGLGLWLCRSLLERHQGTIQYQPSALGGAGFIIKLPAA